MLNTSNFTITTITQREKLSKINLPGSTKAVHAENPAAPKNIANVIKRASSVGISASVSSVKTTNR